NAQRVLRYDPTDPNNLDGNNDGVACTDWTYSTYPNDRDTTAVTRVTPTTTATQTSVPTLTPTPTRTPLPTNTPTQTSTPTPTVYTPPAHRAGGASQGSVDSTPQARARGVLRAAPPAPNRLDTTPRDGLAWGAPEAAADGVPSGMMPPPFDGV